MEDALDEEELNISNSIKSLVRWSDVVGNVEVFIKTI